MSSQSSDWVEEQKQKINQNGGEIGWDGQSIKEMIESSERRYEETGQYQGLDELSFKNENRTKYEQLFSQLRGGLVDARETSKDVSASPIVEQEGECCFAVYTPEGDSITLSTGIIVHVHTMSEAIKFMVKHDYEDNPGIEPGDIFSNNDSQVGNVHTCDTQTLLPIFHDGELVAWAGGVTHVIETGGTQPGSMPINQSTRYGDGYYVTCRKTGSDFELDRDWQIEAENNLRTSDFWKLDERTRLTGCLMIRNVVNEIIDDVGVDTWKQFTRESIEDGRRGFQNRVKKTFVPGTYRGVAFNDVPMEENDSLTRPQGKENYIMHAPSETTIDPDATLNISYDGANRWGWHAFNCTPAAMQGGVWVMLTQTVIPNEMVNDGAYFASNFFFPEGTWTNTQNTETAHSLTWHFMMSAWSPLWRQLSQGYYARGFLEEVNAGNPITTNIMQGGGIDQYDQLTAINSFEMTSCGTGALGIKDGEDYTAAIWNPEGDMGDMEIWEMGEPLPFLNRYVKPNTAGYGRHRGGSGFDSLRTVWNAKRWNLFGTADGYMFSDSGMFGGYPSATGYTLQAHDTDLKERFENQEPIPEGDRDPESGHFESNIEGDVVRRDRGLNTAEEFDEYDLYLNNINGGPGYGEPLERRPEEVAEDVNGDYLLPRYAEKVYGVVLETETTDDGTDRYVVDEEATTECRAEIRKERKEKAQPVDDWLDEQRERIEADDAIDVVKKTYKSSMEMSDAFADHFRSFWDLPDDWEPNLSEEEAKKLQGRLDTPERKLWDEDKIWGYEM